ncbi:hypothetical protein [Vibrio sp. B181a]|jgi:hypothetical protein|uniref:Chromosome partitioning protein ParB n=1 Tax=Vibrio jasicida TaxID=766224 RepID=A0AAU9R0N7_9VIBR|nr:hypothetical protein [Vibrio sp. B181a]MDK9770056.1 hypothetical protein [Vibrio sp. B181a]CAH1602089.1 conserved hypothetical protein [Vibrio jasicida]CAH1603616.1 conserved hypothetical protein [Vibrio jasicida]
MDLSNRKKRGNREKVAEPITTITNVSKKQAKQSAPTCYRFNDYDKAEIALAVANAKSLVTTKVTPAKLLRALVRLNNAGSINQEDLAKMIDSL